MGKRQKLRIITFVVLFMLSIANTSMAEESGKYNIQDGEVVFLLDTSSSMNTQDKDRSSIDAVRQAVYSLPSNYKTGLVAYNTGIQTVVPLNSEKELFEQQLEAITYAGYTNAGDGLNQAVDLFSDGEGVERSIVMLSDGEIDMPDPQAKEQSRSLYAEAANRAKAKGAKIFIVAIGSELGNPGMHIFSGAELTDGAIYWEDQSGSLAQIVERITTDRMDFPKQELTLDGAANQIHAEVPGGASRVKLLVAADREISDVTADYSAESGKTITGQGFACVEILNPSSETMDVSFQTADGSVANVKSYLLTEYTVTPQVTAKYRIEESPLRTEKEIKKNVPPQYKHFVDVSVEMLDVSGDYGNIWREAPDGEEVSYTLNGMLYKGTLQQGKLLQTLEADAIDSIEFLVDASNQDAVYCIKQPVTVPIEKISDPVFTPLPDYRPLWLIIGALTAALIVLLILWFRKKNTTVIYMAQPLSSMEPAKKTDTKSCPYSGKLNLYVIRTPDSRDVPPQTYRLFGRKAGRLTLNYILTACGIKFGKIGAEDIVFYPGPDRAVIIMDQSDGCTVLRGTEILKKGMGYPVTYGEKLTVTFDDDATEMEIHYKNLKPSEREGI